MKLLRIDALLVLAAVCAAPAVHAKEEGAFYFGAGAGKATATDYCSSGGGAVVASCDDSDTAFKVYGGYQFTRNVGIEVAYVDLGTYHAAGSFLGTPFVVDTDLTGFTVQLAGIAPIGDKFSLIGRIGAIFWDLSSSVAVGGFPGSTSDTGVDIAVGGGVQYKFTPNFGIRADFDWYPDLGTKDTGEDNIAAVTVGIVFSF